MLAPRIPDAVAIEMMGHRDTRILRRYQKVVDRLKRAGWTSSWAELREIDPIHWVKNWVNTKPSNKRSYVRREKTPGQGPVIERTTGFEPATPTLARKLRSSTSVCFSSSCQVRSPPARL
jgi:hypothetical protein